MVFTKRTSDLPLICQVCGDNARGLNFEVMTCMSCKTFFRRHALKPKTFQCPMNSNCEINRWTRSGCLACRLKKCFSLGMNPQLIRAQPGKPPSRAIAKLTPTPYLPKPLPLNLLDHDQSTLTTFEWNLLSNIIHAYDVHNPVNHTRSLLDHQASLAPKLRSKPMVTLDIVGYLYSTTQSFVQRVPLFFDLPIDARRGLIQRNSDTAGVYNSIFLVRESSALDYSAYVVGCSNLYGQENYLQLKKFISQLERNGTIFKLMLLILSFSGNCSLVLPENHIPAASIASVVHVQHVLVTMFWKYLNYQYGFVGAVKCFNSLIKFILNIIRWSSERVSAQHIDMVDTMIEQTARSLTIDDDDSME